MQKNEILNQILDDFFKHTAEKNCPPSADSVADLHAFCAYAKNWLSKRGVVGVGHTYGGLSLRFIDGEESILFSAPEEESPNMPAVSITGNSGGSVRGAGGVADTSVKIRG